MSSELRRTISFPLLVFYGVGTMVGAGFYALLGEIAGEAGMASPLAFLLSGLLALLSALSFGELASRFPLSAGEAAYVREGFGSDAASRLVGLLVILTGVVSAATLAVASVGFVRDRFDLSEPLGVGLLVLLMAGVAGWGIRQSVGVVAAITILETGALVVAFAINADALSDLPARISEFTPATASTGSVTWVALLSASVLAFYAFVGFEDLVNMAEEVTDVRRSLPRAILASLVIVTTAYVLVATVAVLSVPIETLAESDTPVTTLAGGSDLVADGFWVVSLLAGLNGALVQIVMAARVMYGLADRGQIPRALGAVNHHTQTPLRATALVGFVTLVLALLFPLTTLAEATAMIILVVFALVNLALWRVKRADPDTSGEGLRLPLWVPLTGAVVSVGVLVLNTALEAGLL